MTLSTPKFSKLPLTERLRARLHGIRMRIASKPEEIKKLHSGYWGRVAPSHYYDRVAYRFDQWFKGPHAGFVNAAATLARTREFDRLIEIGCGDGQVLDALREKMPGIDSFVGLDLNPQIIERNKAMYNDQESMTFIHGNLSEIVPLCAARNTMFFAYGGVLEYFPEAELLRIYKDLALKGCAIAFSEPVDPDHDMETTQTSYAFGSENTFSHNHRHLLETAGWTIRAHEQTEFSNIRWQSFIALAPEG